MTNITFPKEVTTFTVDKIYAECVSAIESHAGSVNFDFQHTEEVDGCGLQLILYLSSIIHKRNDTVTVSSPCESLVDAAAVFNVEDVLGLSSATESL